MTQIIKILIKVHLDDPQHHNEREKTLNGADHHMAGKQWMELVWAKRLALSMCYGVYSPSLRMAF